MDDRQSIRHEAYTFLQTHYLGALASVDAAGTPHVTPLYCIVDTNLDIYFTTNTSGAKFRNITARPTVAMSFVNNADLSCVQLRGEAFLVEDRRVEDDILTKLWHLRFTEDVWPIPPIRLFEQKLGHELRIVRIRPTEMTLASFAPTPNGRFTKLFQKVL